MFKIETPWDIFVQGIGIVATVFGLLSFQQKTQKRIVFFQLLCNVLWTTHFFLLPNALAGAMLNSIGALRGIVFYFRTDKQWAQSPVWYGVFSTLFIGAAVFSWLGGDGAWALLPMTAMLCTTVSLALRNPFHVRAVSFFSSPCWMTYNAFHGSLPGVLTEALMICSIITGILRIDIPNMRKKK